MRTFGFRRFFVFPLLSVAIIFIGLFLSVDGIFAQEAPGTGTGGDGYSPGLDEQQQYIVGRFFNDVNGDGIWQDSEALIYSSGFGGRECTSFTGPQMDVPALSITLESYRVRSSDIDLCLKEARPTTSFDAPGYAILYGNFNEVLEVLIPSGWHCSVGSSSVCPRQSVSIPGGGKKFVALAIGIQQDSIDLAFSMSPPELVSAIRDKTLRADVSGSASGLINYTFWWDCSDSTNSVDDASAGSACGDPSDPTKGSVFDGVSETTKSVPHTYPPGDYTAKVIVERGGAIPVERRIDFTVTPPVPSQGYIIGRVFNDKNGNGSRDAGESNIQNGGNLCSGSYPAEVVNGVLVKRITGTTDFSVGPRECDSEGPYYNSGSVSVVPNNTYTVGVDIPSGWVRTTGDQTVTVPAGGLGVTSDGNHPWFGIRQESFISGVVFLDDSGNGLPDNGEQTLISEAGCLGYVDQIILPGAVVSGAGPTNFSTEPDKCLSGSEMPYYVSLDVKPGTYELFLTAPAGWKSTTGSKTVNVVAGDNFAAIDGSWLWFGVQPLGIPQGDHQGAGMRTNADGTTEGSVSVVQSQECSVQGWAGDPDYPAGDINIRVKKDGVVIAGPLLADQLITDPPPDGPIADSWWVGNGCAVNKGDRVSCYFGKTSPISIYSSMLDGLSHLISVEAEDVNSGGDPTGAWVPLVVGGKEKTPRTLQCLQGSVQIDRINADGSVISGTLANVDATVAESCTTSTPGGCSANPARWGPGVDTATGHGANAADLSAYTETVGTCTYNLGDLECSVSVFSDPAGGCDGTNCNHGITVEGGKVTKVVYKYELPDLITNHQPITIIGTLTTGSTLTFKSNVRNQGNGSAITGSYGRWCMDGTEAECAGAADPLSQLNLSTVFGSFDANTNSQDRTSNGWLATTGSHKIWWCADVTKKITESDESNNCTSQSFDVSVAPNNAPVADAGSDQQNVLTGTTVNLNGSGSSDPDGDPITYSWSFVSRPAGSTATFSNPNSVTPIFTADKTGTYDVSLTVSDGVLSDSDDMQVVVTDAPPSSFSLSCTDVVEGADLDPPCDIVVQFSPALKAKSTPATITITDVTANVTFDVVGVFQGYPAGPLPTPASILGFAEVFNNLVQNSYTTSDTSMEFKVQVSKLAANPTNKLIYTVRLRASSGGHEETIDLRLTLKASRSGTGEE